MAANPKSTASRSKKDVARNPIYLSRLAYVGNLSLAPDQSTLLRDSAFLAERGIFTRVESFMRTAVSRPGVEQFERSTEAA